MQSTRDFRRRNGGLPFLPAWPDEERRNRMITLPKGVDPRYAAVCCLVTIATLALIWMFFPTVIGKAIFSSLALGGLLEALFSPPEEDDEDARSANWQ